MSKKTIIIGSIVVLIAILLIYSFFPIIFYRDNNVPGRVYITDRNGIEITNKGNEYGYKKDIEIDFDSRFVTSLLTIEDSRYFSHFGVSIPSKIRAILGNIEAGQITSGGSTITEQYIKNKFFKNSKRNYLQKLREAVLALYYSLPLVPSSGGAWNSMRENKEILLENYINNVYLGNNIYGVGAAMEVYFNKDKLEDLSEEEIVLLISLLHSPSYDDLVGEKFSSYFNIVKERLGYDFERTIKELSKKTTIDVFPFVTNDLSVDEEGRVTIDAKLQAFAEKVANDTLDGLKAKNVTNAAVYAINPKNGEVLIYMGSRGYYTKDIDGQVNVLKSLRQPGSTMKPFLYLQALKEGAGVNSLLIDIESQYNTFVEGTTYISENYSLQEYGLVRFKKALGNSFNNSSVRLARELGLEKVYNFYKQYGFELEEVPEYYGYSLVLGNPSIRLIDLVNSYAKLLDFSDREHYLLYDILSDPDNRDISFGVNSILNTSIYQAVKTGTSTNFRDNLVVSYHPDFVIGVWVGNNDSSSMQGVTGITGAGYIWHQIVEEAIRLGYIKEANIKSPTGVEEREYCLDNTCYRKEINPDREDIMYYSRVLSPYYSDRDIYGTMTSEEKDYLNVLGFNIGE